MCSGEWGGRGGQGALEVVDALARLWVCGPQGAVERSISAACVVPDSDELGVGHAVPVGVDVTDAALGGGEAAFEALLANFLAVFDLEGGEVACGLAGADGGADAGGDLRVEQGGAALEQVEDAVGVGLVDALDGLRQVAEAVGALAELADSGDSGAAPCVRVRRRRRRRRARRRGRRRG